MRSFGKLCLRFLGSSQANSLVLKQRKIQNLGGKLLLSGGLGLSLCYGISQSLVMDGFYEKVIKADFSEGEKRSVQVGPKEEDTVLVVKLDGKYHCLSEKCPHFGFSLSKGPMFDDKVVCPLHMASFSVISGQNEYGPVLDGLEKFEIVEKNGELHIKVPKDKLNVSKTFPMSKKGNDKRRFVIIGGGPAAISAAETLRQSGFEGEITILAKENVFPYDRTMLSKNVTGVDVAKIQFRNKDFFDQHDINFKGSQEVTEIDIKKNSISTKDGNHYHYDSLLIASGGRPRIPKVEGVGLQNVFTIREYTDVTKLRQSLEGKKKVVVIGASFIGLESASSIKTANKELDVTICDVSQAPIEKVLGKEVGKSIQKLHEENGIKFKLQTSLTKIEGNNGKVSKVHLSNGEVIEADVVILGTGMQPNTQFATGIRKDQFGGINTNVYHETSQPNVFAAGDVATYPFYYTGSNIRVEHYNEAIYQGYVSALNMLGKKVVNDNIPFFWTRFWNQSLQYTGHTNNFDDFHIEGDLLKQKFLCYYFLNNRVVAAAAMGTIPHIMIINEAMRHNVLPSAEDIKTGRVTIEDIKKKVQAQGRACRCSRQGNCTGHK